MFSGLGLHSEVMFRRERRLPLESQGRGWKEGTAQKVTPRERSRDWSQMVGRELTRSPVVVLVGAGVGVVEGVEVEVGVEVGEEDDGWGDEARHGEGRLEARGDMSREELCVRAAIGLLLCSCTGAASGLGDRVSIDAS
jgi:hypothetical protein